MTWYTSTQISEHTYWISEPFGDIEPRVGATTVNMYLLLGQERAGLIDTGMGIGDLLALVREITSLPCTVLNTHSHWDHVGANALFAESAIHESEAELLGGERDVGMFRQAIEAAAGRGLLPSTFDPGAYRVVPGPATRMLQDNERIDLGGRVLRVLHIPGHSPGHVAYLDEANGLLFTGDSAYHGPVYACFTGGDPAAFARSIRRLAELQGVTTICPGHNEIITDGKWLGELAACAEAAVAGEIPGRARDDFIVGREFRCGELAVWLPQ